MAKKQGTIKELLIIRNEILQCRQQSPTFNLFNAEKIKRFFTYNAIRLQSADEKLNRLIKKFVRFDADLKPIQLENKDGLVKWDFISDDAKHAFEIEYKEFVNRDVTIEY